jgi:hypothetical protein
MEPHWYYRIHKTNQESHTNAEARNPTIEEQALARIHRIGQKKEVTTVRFIVKDTFEEVNSLVQYCVNLLMRFLASNRNSRVQEGFG